MYSIVFGIRQFLHFCFWFVISREFRTCNINLLLFHLSGHAKFVQHLNKHNFCPETSIMICLHFSEKCTRVHWFFWSFYLSWHFCSSNVLKNLYKGLNNLWSNKIVLRLKNSSFWGHIFSLKILFVTGLSKAWYDQSFPL